MFCRRILRQFRFQNCWKKNIQGLQPDADGGATRRLTVGLSQYYLTIGRIVKESPDRYPLQAQVDKLLFLTVQGLASFRWNRG
jgi:hypothetical protein